MSNIVKELKKIIDSSCLTTIMKKREGKGRYCEAKFVKGNYEMLIIDLDKENPFVYQHSRRPDFIFVSCDKYTNEKVFVIEISMGRNKDTRIIAEQLQAGFRGIEQQMKRTHELNKVQAYPVFCGDTDRDMREKLGRLNVYFLNKKLEIRIMSCGKFLQKEVIK